MKDGVPTIAESIEMARAAQRARWEAAVRSDAEYDALFEARRNAVAAGLAQPGVVENQTSPATLKMLAGT